jgi:signal transduction histidine kinase
MSQQSSSEPSFSPKRRHRFSYVDVGFFTAILILAAIAGLFVKNLFVRVEQTDLVVHTHHVIQQLENLLTDVSDTESTALSYSLAGRTRYLGAYRIKTDAVNEDLAQLRLLTADHRRETMQLPMVEDSVRHIRQVLDRLVTLPHNRITADHLEKEEVLVSEESNAMDAVHAAVTRAQEDMEQLLEVRIADLERTRTHTVILSLSGIAVTTVIAGWLFWTVRRETRTRLQTQEALERSHEQLESRVHERTLQLVDANERLSALSRKIIQIQEAERRSLARDLHDEIGQSLTAVKLNLQEIEDRVEGTLIESLARDSLDALGQLLQLVRSLALELRPSLLDELGLYEASKWYVKQFEKRTGLTIAFDAQNSMERVPEEIEIACFRVLQEALTNVVRHAHATTVSVRLNRTRDHLELSVGDNGVGFSFMEARSRALSGASLGLLGMEERLRLTGGSFHVLSANGTGTEVNAKFPLQTIDAEHTLFDGMSRT